MSDQPEVSSGRSRSDRLPDQVQRPPEAPAPAPTSPFARIGAVDMPVAIDPDVIGERGEMFTAAEEHLANESPDGTIDSDPSNETSTDDDDDTAGSEGTITVDGSQDSGDPGSTGTGETDESSDDEGLTVGSHDTPNEDLGSDPNINPPSREPDEDEVVGPQNPRVEPPTDGSDDGVNRAPIVDYEPRRPELETIDYDGPYFSRITSPGGPVRPSDSDPSDVYTELTGVEDPARRPELEMVGETRRTEYPDGTVTTEYPDGGANIDHDGQIDTGGDFEVPTDGSDDAALNKAPIVDYEERRPELETIDVDNAAEPWDKTIDVDDVRDAPLEFTGPPEPPERLDQPAPVEIPPSTPDYEELTGVEDQLRRPELEMIGSAESDEDEDVFDNFG